MCTLCKNKWRKHLCTQEFSQARVLSLLEQGLANMPSIRRQPPLFSCASHDSHYLSLHFAPSPLPLCAAHRLPVCSGLNGMQGKWVAGRLRMWHLTSVWVNAVVLAMGTYQRKQAEFTWKCRGRVGSQLVLTGFRAEIIPSDSAADTPDIWCAQFVTVQRHKLSLKGSDFLWRIFYMWILYRHWALSVRYPHEFQFHHLQLEAFYM